MIDKNYTIMEKDMEYRRYIQEHISNVQKAWDEIKANDKCMTFLRNKIFNFDNLIPVLDERMLIHDQSKLSQEEFEPYRRQYHSISETEKELNKKDFEAAWVHHYTVNDHHWDHWKNKPNSMPFVSCIEMCCDWIAMSKKFGGTALQWFKDNEHADKEGHGDKGEDIIIGKKQRAFVVEFLAIYYGEEITE